MTGRTHDLAGMTALTLIVAYAPALPSMTLATAVSVFGANFLGSLFPDIDQPTSDLWDNFRGGEILARVIPKALGGHRHLSHSLLGIFLIGLGFGWLLDWLSSIILIDMNLVWQSFMIGVASHILFDMPTKEGVPLFWPLPFSIGIPPIKALRIRSGHFVEKLFVFPGLILLNIYLLYTYYGKFVDLFHALKK